VVERSPTTGGRTNQDKTSNSTLPGDVIKVALVEVNPLTRECLTSILNQAPDIQAVAELPNGHGVQVGDSPDVVLLDIGLANEDSLRVARHVLKDFPDAKVIGMDLLPAHEELQEFVGAGVSGFVMKDAELDVVLKTIRLVASGGKVLPDELAGTLFSEIARGVMVTGVRSGDRDSVAMTPREREVMDLIAEGLSNKSIGKQLHISVHTVKAHLRKIMEKLTLSSRLEIASYVLKRDTTESR